MDSNLFIYSMGILSFIMVLFDNLYGIGKNEVNRASQVLADAFSKDPIWSVLIKDYFDKGKKADLIYQTPVRYSLKYGSVFSTSKNFEGIIAFYPGDKDMTGWRIIWSAAIISTLKIGMKFGKILLEVFKPMREDKKKLDIDPYIYVGILGVLRKYQGQGFGGKLLRALIEKSENEGKAIYLETETEENVKMYEKFGFNVIKEITLPILELPMWEMVRYCS
ncbi:MAG: GNAT family N-acetyltransferase [Candidatus Lokiarchaeota archaeon]|nr:GNAT family N-acetyltransferase [Candidatus Lokiarchaeota archaeon]